MRRFVLTVFTCVLAGSLIGGAQQLTAKPQPSVPQAVKPAVPAQAAPAKPPAPKPAAPFTATIENIMRGPKLIGNVPTGIRFSQDSSKIYFSWQKPDEDRANTWVVGRDGADLKQLSAEETRLVVAGVSGRTDRGRKRLLAAEGGNVVIYDMATGARRLLMKTAVAESNPRWARNDTAITFMRDGNLFLMTLDGGGAGPAEIQLTDVAAAPDSVPTGATGAAAGRGAEVGAVVATGRGGAAGAAAGQGGRGGTDAGLSDSQRFLRDQERSLIDYIKRQAEARQQGGRGGGAQGGRGGRGGAGGPGGPAETIARFQPGPRQTVTGMALSGDENYVYIGVGERPAVAARAQDVPSYVTESAYTETISGRSNVGDAQSRQLLAVLDLKQNRVVWADATGFAGSERAAKTADTPTPRIVNWSVPECSDDGSRCVASVRAQDYKDRWLVTIDPGTGKATVIDTLHDNAWIREGSVSSATGGGFGGGGFGGGGGVTWLPDNKRILFLAEKEGWMHIYSLDVTAVPPVAKALTSGKWEVSSARLSNDRARIYFASNEVHPGERHFYTMPVDGGPVTKITTLTGASDVTVSPDEKSLAVMYSSTNRPGELYVMPFTAGATAKQVTTTPLAEFLAFKWIEPKVITYKARDGALVYARLYTPEMVGAKRDPSRPGVVFVHGAGYLQFVTKAWPASYYREHMFHHILASKGYVVICPDYRASAGYGRDWRTAIYEHMGGKDLEDSVDAAKYLAASERVDPKRIGIYGGSYGGFLTLMAMFTTPDVFAAGAALRPVTDWAHYNHTYTAEILNAPQIDPEAYKRSSPIYFADGLKGQLLICHGMVDTNVFFQDSVRLVQRLIELGKETWSVAPYPVENHSFTEATSWTDEYKRIFRLFETHLRR